MYCIASLKHTHRNWTWYCASLWSQWMWGTSCGGQFFSALCSACDSLTLRSWWAWNISHWNKTNSTVIPWMCDQKTATHKYEACTFGICWRMLMDEGTATVRNKSTGIRTGVPLMHKLPYLIYKWFLGLLHRSLYHSSNRLLSDMNEQLMRTFFTGPKTWQSHGDKSRLYLLIDWLIN